MLKGTADVAGLVPFFQGDTGATLDAFRGTRPGEGITLGTVQRGSGPVHRRTATEQNGEEQEPSEAREKDVLHHRDDLPGRRGIACTVMVLRGVIAIHLS